MHELGDGQPHGTAHLEQPLVKVHHGEIRVRIRARQHLQALSVPKGGRVQRRAGGEIHHRLRGHALGRIQRDVQGAGNLQVVDPHQLRPATRGQGRVTLGAGRSPRRDHGLHQHQRKLVHLHRHPQRALRRRRVRVVNRPVQIAVHPIRPANPGEGLDVRAPDGQDQHRRGAGSAHGLHLQLPLLHRHRPAHMHELADRDGDEAGHPQLRVLGEPGQIGARHLAHPSPVHPPPILRRHVVEQTEVARANREPIRQPDEAHRLDPGRHPRPTPRSRQGRVLTHDGQIERRPADRKPDRVRRIQPGHDALAVPHERPVHAGKQEDFVELDQQDRRVAQGQTRAVVDRLIGELRDLEAARDQHESGDVNVQSSADFQVQRGQQTRQSGDLTVSRQVVPVQLGRICRRHVVKHLQVAHVQLEGRGQPMHAHRTDRRRNPRPGPRRGQGRRLAHHRQIQPCVAHAEPGRVGRIEARHVPFRILRERPVHAHKQEHVAQVQRQHPRVGDRPARQGVVVDRHARLRLHLKLPGRQHHPRQIQLQRPVNPRDIAGEVNRRGPRDHRVCPEARRVRIQIHRGRPVQRQGPRMGRARGRVALEAQLDHLHDDARRQPHQRGAPNLRRQRQVAPVIRRIRQRIGLDHRQRQTPRGHRKPNPAVSRIRRIVAGHPHKQVADLQVEGDQAGVVERNRAPVQAHIHQLPDHLELGGRRQHPKGIQPQFAPDLGQRPVEINRQIAHLHGTRVRKCRPIHRVALTVNRLGPVDRRRRHRHRPRGRVQRHFQARGHNVQPRRHPRQRGSRDLRHHRQVTPIVPRQLGRIGLQHR